METLPGESASAETSEDPPDGELTKEDVSAETSGAPKLAHPGTESPSLVALMRLTREEWDAFIRGSAIRRAGYAGFNRNVAVAMGNWFASVEEPPDEAVAVLRDAVEHDGPLVAEHAAWALGRAVYQPPHSHPRSSALEDGHDRSCRTLAGSSSSGMLAGS